MTDVFDVAPAAFAACAAAIDGLTAEQLALRTPCDDFTVADVIDHLHLAMTRLAALAGATLDPSDDLGTLFDGALIAWRERGLSGTVELRGELAAQRAADLVAMELAIHGWDVATATGRPYALDDVVVGHLAEAANDIIPSRRGKAFGAEVAAPADATSLERLIAFAGRTVRT